MKKVLIAAAVATLLAAGVVFWFVSNLDSIVKNRIERVGSDATGTSLTLESVEVNLGDGRAVLSGLELANPTGFSQDQVLVFDEVSITLDLASFKSDRIVVKEISILAPEILYEITQSGSNLKAIEDYASARTGKSGQAQPSKADDPTAKADESGKGEKIIIENFYLKSAALRLKIPGAEKDLNAAIPDLHLQDIGKQVGGVTANQVAIILINKVVPYIVASATKLDLRALLGKAGLDPALASKLGNASQSLESLKSLEPGGAAAGESLSKQVEGASKTLKKLLQD
jgi:hypothetical protein|tara:strand:+ start:45 stop:902 length:858 start_codon:yes stop_codon:yes gene_type:complete